MALLAGTLIARRGGAPALAWGLVAAGVLLVALALVRPFLLAPLAGWWMRVATRISSVTTPVILTVVYLVALTPMAWLRRTVGRSPIARARDSSTYWVRRSERSPSDARSSLEHQF